MVEKPVNTDSGSVGADDVQRTAVRRAGTLTRRRVADPRLTHLARMAAEWKAELEKCLEDSRVETVHRIRTGTRRVEAMVDVLTGEAAEENPALREAAAKWRQQLRRIRRAAAPVRDLDVHRQLIEKFARVARAGGKDQAGIEQSEVGKREGPPEIHDAVGAQAEKLDAWLKHSREQRALELTKQIARRLGKLDGLASDFATAWQTRHGRGRPLRKAALAGLEVFVELSDGMPLLDAGNLHNFRKGAKKARYVTEAGGDDVHAKAVGRVIKRVQDAIGDWHDWLCLAEEADLALGGEGQELNGMLGVEVERSFEEAKRVTERMRGRLVGEWRALHRV